MFEMDEEVVYIEEQNEFNGKGPKQQRVEGPDRTNGLRRGCSVGPPRNIFGTTPSHKAPQNLDDYEDYNFDAEDYSSQGSFHSAAVVSSIDTNIPLTGRPPQYSAGDGTGSSNQFQRLETGSHHTPMVAKITSESNSHASTHGTTPGWSKHTPSAGIVNSVDNPRNVRLHSQTLDRPAHWGGPTSAVKTSAGVRRSSIKPQRRRSDASQPVYTNSFSTLNKPPPHSKAPTSLDRLSFQPSWIRAKTPTSAPTATINRLPRVEDDIDSNWQGRVDDDHCSFGLPSHGDYDRIDDLSNSLAPHGYGDNTLASAKKIYATTDIRTETPSGVVYHVAPISPPPARVLPVVEEFDTPVKTGKRKLKHYGALLKKVKQVEDGKDARWLNIHNDGILHCNTDSVRYDLNDPRCGASTCLDVQIINSVEDNHLKLHYGIEIFSVQVNQIRRRNSNSVVFEAISPQTLNLKRNGANCNTRADETVASNDETTYQLKPGSQLLGYLRSDTVQFLIRANMQQPLKNVIIRVYDYMLINPSELNILSSPSASDTGLNYGHHSTMIRVNLPRLLCTKLVELRQ